MDVFYPGKHASISKQIGMDAGVYCQNRGGFTAAWLGYPDQAKGHVRAAWESAERYESKLFTNDALWFSTWISLELEAVKRLARLWMQQGKGQQARKMLQPLYPWFTEGLDTPMLIEARELLAELAPDG